MTRHESFKQCANEEMLIGPSGMSVGFTSFLCVLHVTVTMPYHIQWQDHIERLKIQRTAFDNKLNQTLSAAKLRNVLYKRRLRQQSVSLLLNNAFVCYTLVGVLC